MDDDVPGQEGAAKFAQKLGIKRYLCVVLLRLSGNGGLISPPSCLLVHTKEGDPSGPKDANDAIRLGKVL